MLVGLSGGFYYLTTMKDIINILSNVKECPPAGQGVHRWVYHVVCTFLDHRAEHQTIIDYCERHATRALQPNEVENAIGSRLKCQNIKSKSFKKPNPIIKKRAIDYSITQENLEMLSPVSNPQDMPSESIIDLLFPNNPLLCCGVANSAFKTITKVDWGDSLRKMRLIVPSPMSSKMGFTQSGKPSSHTLSNTGQRRFLVVEFDDGTLDQQASIHYHLGTKFPLTLIVFSGSKSLHGWYYVQGSKESHVKEFFNYACSLGADRATWTKSQFVRMPNGVRDNERKQNVIFFNPKTIK